MASRLPPEGMSLIDAARAAGVAFADEAQPQSRFAQANGLRLHYLDWGSPEHPAVLLLHGFAQTCHSWDFTSLSLCDRFHVIALDQRGHGDSDWSPKGDYSPEAFQSDLGSIVESLEVERLSLIGLSMGGRTAFTYAAAHPQRVTALAIVDAGPRIQSVGASRIRRFIRSEDEIDSFEDFVRRAQEHNPHRPVEQIRGSIVHNVKRLPSGKWTWKYDKLLRSRGLRPDSDPGLTGRLWGYLEGLTCPTLVVRGARSDILAPETAEAMVKRIPEARLVTVEDAGHLVPGDNPVGFIEEASRFLAKVVLH